MNEIRLSSDDDKSSISDLESIAYRPYLPPSHHTSRSSHGKENMRKHEYVESLDFHTWRRDYMDSIEATQNKSSGVYQFQPSNVPSNKQDANNSQEKIDFKDPLEKEAYDQFMMGFKLAMEDEKEKKSIRNKPIPGPGPYEIIDISDTEYDNEEEFAFASRPRPKRGARMQSIDNVNRIIDSELGDSQIQGSISVENHAPATCVQSHKSSVNMFEDVTPVNVTTVPSASQINNIFNINIQNPHGSTSASPASVQLYDRTTPIKYPNVIYRTNTQSASTATSNMFPHYFPVNNTQNRNESRSNLILPVPHPNFNSQNTASLMVNNIFCDAPIPNYVSHITPSTQVSSNRNFYPVDPSKCTEKTQVPNTSSSVPTQESAAFSTTVLKPQSVTMVPANHQNSTSSSSVMFGVTDPRIQVGIQKTPQKSNMNSLSISSHANQELISPSSKIPGKNIPTPEKTLMPVDEQLLGFGKQLNQTPTSSNSFNRHTMGNKEQYSLSTHILKRSVPQKLRTSNTKKSDETLNIEVRQNLNSNSRDPRIRNRLEKQNSSVEIDSNIINHENNDVPVWGIRVNSVKLQQVAEKVRASMELKDLEDAKRRDKNIENMETQKPIEETNENKNAEGTISNTHVPKKCENSQVTKSTEKANENQNAEGTMTNNHVPKKCEYSEVTKSTEKTNKYKNVEGTMSNTPVLKKSENLQVKRSIEKNKNSQFTKTKTLLQKKPVNLEKTKSMGYTKKRPVQSKKTEKNITKVAYSVNDKNDNDNGNGNDNDNGNENGNDNGISLTNNMSPKVVLKRLNLPKGITTFKIDANDKPIIKPIKVDEEKIIGISKKDTKINPQVKEVLNINRSTPESVAKSNIEITPSSSKLNKNIIKIRSGIRILDTESEDEGGMSCRKTNPIEQIKLKSPKSVKEEFVKAIQLEQQSKTKIIEKSKNDKSMLSYYQSSDYQKICCLSCGNSYLKIVEHYVREHPQEEVKISRLKENITIQAIQECNIEPPENATLCCRFCNYHTKDHKNFYYHCTSHTGEFKFQCPLCPFKATVLTNAYQHFENKHSLFTVPTKVIITEHHIDNSNKFYAYVCNICNYVQMDRENVLKHLQEKHTTEESVKNIAKINLASYIPDDKLEEMASQRTTRKRKLVVDDAAVRGVDIFQHKFASGRGQHQAKKTPTSSRKTSAASKKASAATGTPGKKPRGRPMKRKAYEDDDDYVPSSAKRRRRSSSKGKGCQM